MVSLNSLKIAARMKIYLLKCLRELVGTSPEVLIEKRYQKFRHMGVFLDAGATTTDSAAADEPAAAANPNADSASS